MIGKPTRMLVTSVGGALAPLNIRLITQSQRHDVWVLGVDQRPEAVGRYFADAFAVVPAGGAPNYIGTVVGLIEQHGIDLVLPWSDEEALALAAARDRIQASGAVLACAPIRTLETMSDKAASYQLLSDAGVRAPEFEIANTPEDLESTIARYEVRDDGFAVKPVVSRGNRGIYVVRPDVSGASPYLGSREWHVDPITFRKRFMADVIETLPVMVCERLYPPAYDIDVLAWEGKLLRAMPRERMNPAGVPFTGGILRPTGELLALADKVTSVLGLSWLYDYDIMRARSGEAVVLELNPRPSGSIAAAVLAGVPFYDDLISLAKGEVLPDIALPDTTAIVPFTDCRIVPLDTVPAAG